MTMDVLSRLFSRLSGRPTCICTVLIAFAIVVPIAVTLTIRSEALYCGGSWFPHRCPNLDALEAAVLMTPGECNKLGHKWEPYAAAAGRFVVASGKGVDEKGQERTFSTTPKPEQGGTYRHALEVLEMPAHAHSYRARGTATEKLNCDGGCTSFPEEESMTGSKGQGEPHPNVPPYIALNVCHIPNGRD